jgi:class 3 adenylate cyclase
MLDRGVGVTSGVHARLASSQRLAGRYDVLRLIGAGSRKRVTLVHDIWLERDVVACALQTPTADESARLRREAALLARLGSSPSIVAVHDLLDVDGAPVMICQYLAGGSLQDRLRHGPVDLATAVGIASDVAAALSWTHRAGVVHRDVKPGNIWLDETGRAVLGDFGLAVSSGTSPQPCDLLVGTAAYVAPEQLVAEGTDERSDLHSLGAVLYELLTGRPPFGDGSAVAVMAKVLQERPPPPSSLRPGLSQDVDDLIEQLLAKAPEQRPESADEVLSSLTRLVAPVPVRPPAAAADGFVGRAVELVQLRSALADAKAGRGSVTLLLGEPGVGKTRMALELARFAAQDGWTVLTGRCPESGVAPAFRPWTQVLQAALRCLPDQEHPTAADRRLLAAVVPELDGEVPPAEPPDREASRFLLFDAATRLLRRVAGARPLLVLVDDAHWADRASTALAVHLARELVEDRVAVVLCARDVALDDPGVAPAVSELTPAAGRTMHLHGLSLEETALFLEASLAVRPDRLLLRELHERTDGNPFHIAELVRLLQSEQGLTTEGLVAVERVAPTGVREVLHRRLRQMSAPSLELLQTMSVIGREALLPVIAGVHAVEPETALRLLDEALAARLLVAVDGRPQKFRFAHALVREALYDSLPASHRVDLHRRTTEALRLAHPHEREAPAAELAHHAVRAALDGDAEPAVLWSVRAARAAAIASAYEDEVLHYGRAVELAGDVTLPSRDGTLPSFGALLLELGEAQHRLGQSEQARLTFLRAAGEGIESADPELLARAALGYGLGLGGFGYVEHADGVLLSLLERALDELDTQDSPLRVRLLARLATELYFTPFRSRRLSLSRQALEVAHRLHDPASELVALYSRTLAVLGPDHLNEQRRTADRVVWLSGTLADPEMAFRGHHLRLMVALEAGGLEQARAEVAACRSIATMHRQPAHDWHAAVFETMLALAAGRHDEALQLAERALQSGRRGSADMAQVMHGAQLLVVRWAQGRLGELLDAVRAFADAYPHAPAWRATLAFCCTEAGRPELARVELEALAARDFVDLPEDGNYLLTATMLAHVAARLGDVERARSLESKLRPFGDRHVVIAAGAAAFGSVRLPLGVARAACGDLDGAVHELTAAHHRHQQVDLPALAVWSGEELARVLVARGRAADLQAAREVLADALPVAGSLGMSAHVPRLESLLAQCGVAWPDLHPDPDRERVTVLISDVASSTRLTEALGERAVHALLGDHRRMVEATAQDEGGIALKAIGDAVLAAFPSADAGLRCALRLQQHFERTASAVRVRIGVHTGPVLRQGDSMYGRTMILAFRVADRARAGEVLVSAETRSAVRTALAFEKPKMLQLKGIAEPQQVHRLCWRTVPRQV